MILEAWPDLPVRKSRRGEVRGLEEAGLSAGTALEICASEGVLEGGRVPALKSEGVLDWVSAFTLPLQYGAVDWFSRWPITVWRQRRWRNANSVTTTRDGRHSRSLRPDGVWVQEDPSHENRYR